MNEDCSDFEQLHGFLNARISGDDSTVALLQDSHKRLSFWVFGTGAWISLNRLVG
jgi:hypothetical protein